MEKNLLLDAFIKELLASGKRLSISEIQEFAKDKLPKETHNAKQLYNFVYSMRNRGELQKTTDGKYYIENCLAEEQVVEEQALQELVLDEFADFEVVDPSTTKSPKEVLSVMSSGTIGVNSTLLKHFKEFCAEIRLKKDCTEIIMLKNGQVMTNLGKQGRVKNYNLAERLKQANMKFPIYFVGEWNEEKGIWHGEILPYNPNKGKREKQK